MIKKTIRLIVVFAWFFLLSTFSYAGEQTIDLKRFADIKNPELQMDYISKFDNELFNRSMPNINVYYENYRILVSNNIHNPKLDLLFNVLLNHGETSQQIHILGVLYQARNQQKYFDGFAPSNADAYKERLRESVMSNDDTKARQLFKQACNSNYIDSCLSYFFAVNNYNIPCMMNVEKNGCNQRMDLLAEAEQMYLKAAIYNYELIPAQNKTQKSQLALMISQIYTGGVTGALTAEHYPEWMKKHPFPRDARKAKEWANLAASATE